MQLRRHDNPLVVEVFRSDAFQNHHFVGDIAINALNHLIVRRRIQLDLFVALQVLDS